MECQRDPLDEQFDELFKDMSEELREKIDMELATDGDAAAACDDSDTDVLVVEYVSDDENLAPADKVNQDSESDDECDHVLKASDVMSFRFTTVVFIQNKEIGVSTVRCGIRDVKNYVILM